MAKRRQSAAEAVDLTPETSTPPQRPEIVQPQPTEAAAPGSEQPAADQPARQWRANPFPLKTVNLDGYKVQLQESRPERNPDDKPEGKRWEMQIKFGSGSKDDMPSAPVLDFIKSHRLKVKTREGKDEEVQLFKWNDDARAWGMEIAFNSETDTTRAGASREKALRVFNDVVKMVAEDRGVGRGR